MNNATFRPGIPPVASTPVTKTHSYQTRRPAELNTTHQEYGAPSPYPGDGDSQTSPRGFGQTNMVNNNQTSHSSSSRDSHHKGLIGFISKNAGSDPWVSDTDVSEMIKSYQNQFSIQSITPEPPPKNSESQSKSNISKKRSAIEAAKTDSPPSILEDPELEKVLQLIPRKRPYTAAERLSFRNILNELKNTKPNQTDKSSDSMKIASEPSETFSDFFEIPHDSELLTSHRYSSWSINGLSNDETRMDIVPKETPSAPESNQEYNDWGQFVYFDD